MKALRLRFPWWGWLGVGLGALLLAIWLFGFRVRSQGLALLRRTIAEQEAAGLGFGPEALMAEAPRVDLGLQGRWRSWEEAFPRSSRKPFFTGDAKHMDDWIRGARPDAPAGLAEFVEENRALYEAHARLLAEGPPVFGVMGTIARDLRPGTATSARAAALRGPDLLAAKAAATWYRLAALLAADPGPCLDALDAEQEGFRRPGTLLEAMIALAIAGVRDRAYLDLAIAGRLPDAHAARWLAERPAAMAACARGWRGERLLWTGALARDILEGRLGPADLEWTVRAESGSWPGESVRAWLRAPSDAALLLETEALAERRLRGERVRVPTTEEVLAGDRGPVLAAMLPNFLATTCAAIEMEAQHRMARIAVRLLGLRRERGRLPADDAEARAWLGEDAKGLDVSADLVRLLYERPAGDTLRLRIDPDGPLPDIYKTAAEVRENDPFLPTLKPGPLVFNGRGIRIELPPRSPK